MKHTISRTFLALISCIIFCALYLLFPGGLRAETFDMQKEEYDFIIYDSSAPASYWYPPFKRSITNVKTADIDNDDIDDIVVLRATISNARFLSVIYGNKTISREIDLASQSDFTLHSSSPALIHSYCMGDVNGDSYADLVLGLPDAAAGAKAWAGKVSVIFGGPSLQGNTSIAALQPDIEIRGEQAGYKTGQSLSLGDVNGDGIADIVISAPFARPLNRTSAGKVYVVYGSRNFPAHHVIDLAATPGSLEVYGSSRSAALRGIGEVSCADINGDGKDDVIIADPKKPSVYGRSSAGEVDIIFGRENYASPWDLVTSSADVTIFGKAGAILLPGFTADINADGKKDLVLNQFVDDYHPYAIFGSAFASGQVIDMDSTTAFAHYNGEVTAVLEEDFWAGYWIDYYFSAGDFDGDGRDDICASFPTVGRNSMSSGEEGRAYLLLSAKDDDLFSPAPFSVTATNIVEGRKYKDYLSSMILGDINGDGCADLFSSASYANERLGQGGIYVIYGAAPLTSPRAAVVSFDAKVENRVSLSLGVDGRPAEMLFSGDITDSFKDTWIPFAAERNVTLSGSAGSKNISVKFRNSIGRVSSLCSLTYDFTPTLQRGAVLTNYVVPSNQSPARFTYQLTTPGRVTAQVYSSSGELIRTLMDEDRLPEAAVLTWDGTNGGGTDVVSGIYTLYLDINGHREKHDIVVEK